VSLHGRHGRRADSGRLDSSAECSCHSAVSGYNVVHVGEGGRGGRRLWAGHTILKFSPSPRDVSARNLLWTKVVVCKIAATIDVSYCIGYVLSVV